MFAELVVVVGMGKGWCGVVLRLGPNRSDAEANRTDRGATLSWACRLRLSSCLQLRAAAKGRSKGRHQVRSQWGGDENCLLRCDVMNGTVDYETQSFPQCLRRSVEEVVVVGGRDLWEDGVLVVDLPRPSSYMLCVFGQVGQVRGPSRSPTCVVNPALVVVRLAYLPTTSPSGRISSAEYYHVSFTNNPRSGPRQSPGHHLPHPCPPRLCRVGTRSDGSIH